MPNYLIAAGKSDGAAQAKNITTYYYPMGYLFASTTEANQQLLARDSYTLSNLYVYVSANTITAGNFTTVTSRKQTPPGAAGDGAQSVSINGGATGAFTDAVNSDSLVSGDLFDTKVVTPNAGTSITFTIISYILSTVSNTTPILATTGGFVLEGSWVEKFTIAGVLFFIGLETDTYYTFRVAATLSNLRCYISANSMETASTLITRINAGNGSQSVSIGAYATGGLEDTTNSDNISAGQNVNYQLTTGVSIGGEFTIRSIQVKSTSAGRQVAVAIPGSGTLAKALTRFVTIEGDGQRFNASETLVQATARCAFTAKNMYVNISANTVTATSVFTLRKDTGNSALTVSVGANATGQFEDTDPAHAVDFVAASLINWGIVTGATGTNITIVCIGFELAQPAAPPTGIQDKSANMASKLVAAGLI